MAWFSSWDSGVFKFFYPPSCLLCGYPGARGVDLCAACFGEMPWNRRPCPRCAAPLPPDVEDQLCGNRLNSLPARDAALSPLYRLVTSTLYSRYSQISNHHWNILMNESADRGHKSICKR